MFEAMERGELAACYVIGENPAQSEADTTARAQLLEGLDCLIVQDIFLTDTAELAHVVLPGIGDLVRGRGHGDQQRAPRAAGAQGARPARRRARRHRDHLRASPGGSAPTGATPTAEDLWNELRTLSPMHGGMSYARLEALGGIQWPCPDEDDPGTLFLHARLWEDPVGGPPAPFSVVEQEYPVDELTDGVPDPADHRAPPGLLQHRRADRRLHARRCGGGETLDLSPEDGRALGIAEGELVRISSRRGYGRRAGAHRPDPAPGPGVHDPPLPRAGRDQHPHDRRDRPEVGHGRVQGDARSGWRSCPLRAGRDAARGRVAMPAR